MMRAIPDSDKSNIISKAFQELERRCTLPFAFVLTKTTVIFAQSPLKADLGITPASVLLACYFEEHQDLAFFVLRNKIYCNYKPTAFCFGMAKVVAKGVYQFQTQLDKSESIVPLNFIEVDYRLLNDIRLRRVEAQLHLPKDKNYSIDQLRQLAEEKWPPPALEEKLHDQDRPVWAVLLDQNGKIITSARNTNKLNKTQHAEVNCLFLALETLNSEPRPQRLIVSHKPCKMCAGLIWEACRRWGGFEVLYLKDEIGGFSRHTVLDLASHDRELFANSLEKYLAIQQKHQS